ncbi:hypothetical protein KY334_05840 [Candidatus Woesearchaeota archaeon]|nr:hypothetical protein [Candidatus Woesearchaeota archaeon]
MKKINIEDIWAEKHFDTKKEMLLEFIKEFQHPKKAPLFVQKANWAKTLNDLDQIALNIHMAGEGMTNGKVNYTPYWKYN